VVRYPVNAIYRIGDHLAARFPLQPGDVEATRRWLAIEAAAVQELAGQTLGAVWYYRDSNPAMSRMGRRTLSRILADHPPA